MLRCLGAAGLAVLLTAAAGATPLAPGKGAGPRLGPIAVLDVILSNRAAWAQLNAAGYDIDAVKGDRVRLYADEEEMRALRAAGFELTARAMPAASAGGPSVQGLGGYNNYSNVTAMLTAYAAGYSNICRLVSLGKSVQNREIWAMKITTHPDDPSDKPQFRYASTHHGNEPVGTEMCLYFIDALLNGYLTNDARIVNLVGATEIWVVPVLNPDGLESKSRYNANGFDLNRSFPEGSATNLGNLVYGPPMHTNGLQPEVRHLMTWTATRRFALGASFHTGSLVFNYPYDNDNLGSVFSPSPDEALFFHLGQLYATNNPPMWNSLDFPHGIINGAEWYAVSGGMQDWNYRFAGNNDVTIELTDDQWPNPPASQLPTLWSQNRESMLSYLAAVHLGVRGILSDAVSGLPVGGDVRVEGQPHMVFSDLQTGSYRRMLLPGAYRLWFHAPGYMPLCVTNVAVTNGAATRLDVALEPVSARFSAKINFQPAAAAVPTGFLADTGAVYGLRGNGLTYGWETTVTSAVAARNAGRSQDPRYDTLCQTQTGGNHVWRIAVSNGPYRVHLAAGDPAASNGFYRLMAGGDLLLDGSPAASNRWLEAGGTVIVTDSALCISNAPGAVGNRLAFVEISAREPVTIEQWRAVYFATTNNTGAAADEADPDGDGFLNRQEFLAGTDPRDSASALRFSTAGNGGDGFSISFETVSNKRYGVYCTENLLTGPWDPLTNNILGTGGPVWIVDPDAAAHGTRFWRVQLQP